MIKRWHLKNFKAFRDHPPIDFSMINVLAGANSSGKSSLIQSMLLLKQTLQYGSENRPLALNGPLLRLGGFDDVRNFEASSEPLELGFDIEISEDETKAGRLGPWVRTLRRQGLAPEADAVRAISLKLAFCEKGSETRVGGTSLNPDLQRTELRTYRVRNDEATAENYAVYTRREATDEDDEEGTVSFPFQVEVDQASIDELCGNRPEGQIKSGTTSSFFPSWVAIRFNEAAQDAIRLVEGLFSTSDLPFDDQLTDEHVPPDVAKVINDWLMSQGAGPVVSDELLATDFHEALVPFLRQTRRSGHLGGLLTQILKPNEQLIVEIGQLRSAVLSALLGSTQAEYSVEIDVPRSVSRVSDYLRDYLKQGIRYLGPLRDSPRPVYQLEALESTTDVGYRGEHTAAVLDLNKARPVIYRRPPSDTTEEDYGEKSQRAHRSLHDAVVEWLTYLGVASEVETIDAGVYGNRLQVATNKLGRLHDLTNVGVGVSQVLPIVVMALLAPPGSFLIFEQPELHLHPKVQARLGDFFLALALDGKQILLETHSEYLVDRFRLRIALASTDKVLKLVNVFFSEKVGANTRLDPIEISEFGAVVNWPKDFFEQSQRDVGRIVKAASSKRRAKSSK